MSHMPHTRLSTRLSGSAKETEHRILNIFRCQHRRPPTLLMALLLCVIALCGSLVACQTEEHIPESPSPDTSPDSSQPDQTPSNQSLEAEAGETILDYPIQAGGYDLTLRLYVKAISEDYPDQCGVRQVAVADGDGQILQIITVQDAITAEWGADDISFNGYTQCWSEEALVSVVDLDSDGNQDFGLFGWITNGANLPYYYWMWNAVEEKFEYGFCLSNAEPTDEQTTSLPNIQRGVILSSTREGSGEYYTTRYYYAPSLGLIPLRQTREIADGTGGLTPSDYLYLNGDWVQIPDSGKAIPQNTLSQLLGRYGAEEYDYLEGSKFKMEFYLPGDTQTLGLIRFDSGTHTGGYRNFILGVVDNTTWQPVGKYYVIRGDIGGFCFWTGEDGSTFLLCSTEQYSQGYASSSDLYYLRYDGITLERLTALPDAVRESWTQLYGDDTPIPEDLLDNDCSFWEDHFPSPVSDGVLDIYRYITDDSYATVLDGHLRFH